MTFESKFLRKEVLGRSHTYYCVTYEIFLSFAIPIQNDGCLQEFFKVKNELTFTFVYVLLYIVTILYIDRKVLVFHGLFFLPHSVGLFSTTS